MSDPLSDLFSNVPCLGEFEAGKLGIEVPASLIVAHTGPPIADPIAWIERSRITFASVGMRANVNGKFCPGHDISETRIELRAGMGRPTDPHVLRTLWHEVGHAIDFIKEEHGDGSDAGKLTLLRAPQYTTKYQAMLELHADLIVGLRIMGDDPCWDGDEEDDETAKWMEYARSPKELWAEAVALACTRPGTLMQTRLWPIIYMELKARNISVPEPEVIQMLKSAEKNIGAEIEIETP